MPTCLLERGVATAAVWLPLTEGWIVPSQAVLQCEERVTAALVRDMRVPALMDAVEAVALADEFVVVSDLAVVSQFTSGVAMRTTERPDALDAVRVSLDEVGWAAEALARAVLSSFYGITATTWARGSTDAPVVIVEDAAALRHPLSERFHDLGRAWYILTSLPFTSHVLVVPRALLSSDPTAARGLVDDLQTACAAAGQRLQSLVDHLTDAYDLDADRAHSFFQGQSYRLTQRARSSWRELLHRAGREMGVPRLDTVDIVSLADAT